MKTNVLAIISLVTGIVGCCGISVVALITGVIALSQITGSNGMQKGKGLAIAGIVLGSLWLALTIFALANGNYNFSTTTS